MSILVLLFAAGVWIGACLSQSDFSSLRLVNLLGLISDFLGVLLLSHLVATSVRVKQFVLSWLSFTFAWALLVVPLGMLVAVGFGLYLDWLAATKVGGFAVAMFVYGALPVALYEDIAMLPYSTKFASLDARITTLGGVFVLEAGSSLVQILSKKFFGKKVFLAAPFHLYLQRKGWDEPKIVMRAWLLGFLFAVFGLYIASIR